MVSLLHALKGMLALQSFLLIELVQMLNLLAPLVLCLQEIHVAVDLLPTQELALINLPLLFSRLLFLHFIYLLKPLLVVNLIRVIGD